MDRLRPLVWLLLALLVVAPLLAFAADGVGRHDGQHQSRVAAKHLGSRASARQSPATVGSEAVIPALVPLGSVPPAARAARVPPVAAAPFVPPRG